jgi:hypothetical protein
MPSRNRENGLNKKKRAKKKRAKKKREKKRENEKREKKERERKISNKCNHIKCSAVQCSAIDSSIHYGSSSKPIVASIVHRRTIAAPIVSIYNHLDPPPTFCISSLSHLLFYALPSLSPPLPLSLLGPPLLNADADKKKKASTRLSLHATQSVNAALWLAGFHFRSGCTDPLCPSLRGPGRNVMVGVCGCGGYVSGMVMGGWRQFRGWT